MHNSELQLRAHVVHNVMGRSVPRIEDQTVPGPADARASAEPGASQQAASVRWANREAAAALQPSARQCSADEIARVAVFLGTDDASFMTGTIVPIDGGCTATIAGSEVQTGYSAASYRDTLAVPKL